MENESDVSIMESLMKELEEKLGLKLFKEIYDIIQDNVIYFYYLSLFLFFLYLDGT